MTFGNLLILLVAGVLLVGLGLWLARHYLSADAKAERRRRRSNAPIRSTAKRPMVKLSVKSKKDEKD